MDRITINSLMNKIQRVYLPALPVFCGVGRGTTLRIILVPLTAVGSMLVGLLSAAASGFGWFVSWISSVVILDTKEQILRKLERRFSKVPIALPPIY